MAVFFFAKSDPRQKFGFCPLKSCFKIEQSVSKRASKKKGAMHPQYKERTRKEPLLSFFSFLFSDLFVHFGELGMVRVQG